jgi:hypothetical protein
MDPATTKEVRQYAGELDEIRTPTSEPSLTIGVRTRFIEHQLTSKPRQIWSSTGSKFYSTGCVMRDWLMEITEAAHSRMISLKLQLIPLILIRKVMSLKEVSR